MDRTACAWRCGPSRLQKRLHRAPNGCYALHRRRRRETGQQLGQPNPAAPALHLVGADHGVVADGSQVEQVLELTGGLGAEVLVDFVGEGGATAEGVRMLRRAGDYHVVGYGEEIRVPTIDMVSTGPDREHTIVLRHPYSV